MYVRAPKEMNFIKTAVLKVIKPLYGMPESPIHWFKTFLQHHTEKLSMYQVPLDPCLLYAEEDGALQGLLGMQVDDILFSGSESYLDKEEHCAADFPNKGRKKISNEFVRFNGIEISRCEARYQLRQVSYVKNIPNIPKDEILSFEDFRSIRAKYAYLAYSTMPDILVIVAKLSQATSDVYEKDRKSCLKLLKRLEQEVSGKLCAGLTFVSISVEKAEVFVCIDAAFPCNRGYSSQLGVLCLVRDPDTGDCNIIHYISMKSKRVCKIVLHAELLALVEGFDLGFVIRDALERCTRRKAVNLTLGTDSRSLYCILVKLAQTTERRLVINISLVRQEYEKREITNLVWISGATNPADDLTKETKRNGTLREVICRNNFSPKTESWIERDPPPVELAVEG